jgi:outer membrane receptor protein involved in Fe transport
MHTRQASFYFVIVLAACSMAVSAQDKPADNEVRVLEEIIVTATKRAVKLHDLPLSVGVVTGEELTDIGAIGMDDYWRMIPSLNVKDGPLGGNTAIIRGLSDSVSFSQPESLNAFYLDDVAITFVPGLYATPGDPALVDVARVEVLRGPQGTLVGANAMGGAIRIITNEPDSEESLRSLDLNLSNTAHGGWNYGGRFIINQPLGGGASAIRLAAWYQDDDGYTDDIGLGREDINSEQRQGARLSWLWNASDSLEILARAYSEKIETGDLDFTDPIGKPELGLPTEGDYQVALLSPQPREEELRVATLRIRWQAAWGELYSATSWFEKDTSLNADWSPEFNLNFGFYHLAPFHTEVGQQDLSQELRFSSDGSGVFNWLAGLYYLDQEATRFDTGSAPGIHEDCPGCFPFIGPDEILLQYHEQSSRKDTALFGEVSWRFREDFEATFGGRWYRIKRELASQGFFTIFPLDELVSGEGEDFVPKLSLSWDVSDQTMVYGLVSEGYRPGQFNTPAARDVCGARTIIDSDSLRNYEIGTRTRLADERVGLNVTVFHIDWDDIQTSTFDFDCGFTVLENGGKASSDGLELEFSALLTDNFSLQGGIGYNDAKLEEAIPAFNAPEGQRIPNVPKVTANLAVIWNFAWSDRIGGLFRGDVQYVGSRTTSFDPTLSERTPTPASLDAYYLVNLRLGGDTGRWFTELFIDNLFDEVADLFCCRLFVETYINRPRTIGVRTRYDF